MMREYVFDKKIDEKVKESILNDAKEVAHIEHVEITDDMKHVIVGAPEEEYPVVVTRILNIYCKYSKGNLISFTRFV
nr:hypothetical protein [uncultured Lachnoclostridium sp.]